MRTGANQLDAVIKSSDKVRACDFSHLQTEDAKRKAHLEQQRSVVSSLMIKKKKTQQDGDMASYTFAL